MTHVRDPLANLNLVEADFDWATRKLMDIADAHAGGASCRCSIGRLRTCRLAGFGRRTSAALMQG